MSKASGFGKFMSTEKKGAAKKEALRQEKRKWKKEQSDKIDERKRQARAARPAQGTGYGKKRTEDDRSSGKRSAGGDDRAPKRSSNYAGRTPDAPPNNRSEGPKRSFNNKPNDRKTSDNRSAAYKKPFNNRPAAERRSDDTGGFKKSFSDKKSYDQKSPGREGGFKKAYDGPAKGESRTTGGSKSYDRPARPEGGKRDFKKHPDGPGNGGKTGYKKFGSDQSRRNNAATPFKKSYPERSPRPEAAAQTEGGKLSIKKVKPITDDMPLNKYIAHGGVCSRREAVGIIKAGKVKVNGELILEPGHKVSLSDMVTVSGKPIKKVNNLVYILLNKPKDYITTTDDPQERKTVLDLVQSATTERIYPVGRLDRNTSGVLLLTNDGDLAQKLTHPSNEVKKLYAVTLDKPLTKAHFDAILKGVELEDGPASVDVLAYTDAADKTQIGVEIHSGRNRIVRRIFEHLGYDVKGLDRVTFAGLTKKNVNRGKWRFLTEREVRDLKFFKKGK